MTEPNASNSQGPSRVNLIANTLADVRELRIGGLHNLAGFKAHYWVTISNDLANSSVAVNGHGVPDRFRALRYIIEVTTFQTMWLIPASPLTATVCHLDSGL